MSKKRTILWGAFILTAAGFASRIIGFFYRIFLSRTFGEEGVGLYQLIFPVFALCFSFTTAGIETALSRSVARKVSLKEENEAVQTLFTALSLSLILSLFTTVFIQKNAAFIAIRFLDDKRCIPLLKVMAYAFPFVSIHSCICGYFLGVKKTALPASAQLVEQCARVAAVYFICTKMLQNGSIPSIQAAVAGLVAGDAASAFFCILVSTRKKVFLLPSGGNAASYMCRIRELVPVSVPLTANRVMLNILQSTEAVSIPGKLKQFGFSVSESLSTYGVLTGMALPCILFPSAITNSVALMLLPTIAEVQALDDRRTLVSLIRKVTFYCFSLGCLCMIFFLLFGRFIGALLFHSDAAGDFLITLAWICPFLYSNTTLVSTINGLGKTTVSFAMNTVGILLRIGSVFLLIPHFGIIGYLWGMLASQLIVTVLAVSYLYHFCRSR